MYLNNNIFRFSLISGIHIITHVIFMKIRIVHTLRADWLYITYRESLSIKTSGLSVLGTYLGTYIYIYLYIDIIDIKKLSLYR